MPFYILQNAVFTLSKNILIMTTLHILRVRRVTSLPEDPDGEGKWCRIVQSSGSVLFHIDKLRKNKYIEVRGDRSAFVLSLGEQRQHQLGMGTWIPLLNFIIINSAPGIKPNSRNTASPHTLRQESFIGESTSEIVFYHELMVFEFLDFLISS